MPRLENFTLPDPSFHEPIFREGKVLPDPAGFLVPHGSDEKLYATIQALLQTKVVDFPKSRRAPDALYGLAEAYGSRGNEVVAKITEQKRLVFHAVGDTGEADSCLYGGDLSVADQLTLDCNLSTLEKRPAFMLHLGDVVYNFGEAQFYYDQFYEPYRGYPAPIFAIPGNHDSFVLPKTATGATPLDTFMRNFCAEQPVVTPEAASLHRTAMTQPGVYYALDAPFARILCLFSNALEDPGVISGKDAPWSGLVPNYQLEFLEAQLQRIKTEGFKGAVLIAVHHPPFNYIAKSKDEANSKDEKIDISSQKGMHGPSRTMLHEIDEICEKVGVYPHAFISGHAHNYQRYSRTILFHGQKREVPFIVCGAGGHEIRPLVDAKLGNAAIPPHFGEDVFYLDVEMKKGDDEKMPLLKRQGLILEKYNDVRHGYLRISVDEKQLAIAYHLAGVTQIAQSRFDKVTVDLANRVMLPS